MKKIVALLLVAILALALVACGGGDETTAPDTTAKPTTDSTTAPTVTTTEPTEETTEPQVTDAPPVVEDPPLFEDGIDIMNGDFENMAVNPFWNQGSWPCAFEDQHASLDFNWALVFTMDETENGIYEQLIFTDPDAAPDAPNSTTGIVNDEYKWVVVIDEVEYEIKRFSLLNDRTKGYIRMDLGADFKLSEEDPHDYEIVLKIFDAETNELAFWAWFTDPDCAYGPYTFEKPAPIVMVDDPDRDPADKPLPTGSLVGIEGAAGFNADETYVNLFDGRVRSKLCTNDVTTPIQFYIPEGAKSIVSYSLVGANDDESYSTRVVTNFVLYGSADGQTWTQIDAQNVDPTTITVTNYGEANYKLQTPVTYQYFKLEISHATDMYQISEIILYTEE